MGELWFSGLHLTKVVKPSEQAFDFPSSPIPSRRASVLGGVFAVAPMGSDQLDTCGEPPSRFACLACGAARRSACWRSISAIRWRKFCLPSPLALLGPTEGPQVPRRTAPRAGLPALARLLAPPPAHYQPGRRASSVTSAVSSVAPTPLTVNGSWVASCWLARPPMLNTFLEVFLSRSTLRPAFNRNAGQNRLAPAIDSPGESLVESTAGQMSVSQASCEKARKARWIRRNSSITSGDCL